MKKKKKYNVSLKDLLANGYLLNDNIFHKFFHEPRKDKIASGTILEDGKIKTNNATYKSVSSAAKSWTKVSVNGWKWWYTENKEGDNVLLEAIRKKYIEDIIDL